MNSSKRAKRYDLLVVQNFIKRDGREFLWADVLYNGQGHTVRYTNLCQVNWPAVHAIYVQFESKWARGHLDLANRLMDRSCRKVRKR